MALHSPASQGHILLLDMQPLSLVDIAGMGKAAIPAEHNASRNRGINLHMCTAL